MTAWFNLSALNLSEAEIKSIRKTIKEIQPTVMTKITDNYHFISVEEAEKITNHEVIWSGAVDGKVAMVSNEMGKGLYDGEWTLKGSCPAPSGLGVYVHIEGVREGQVMIGRSERGIFDGAVRCFWLTNSKVWRNNQLSITVYGNSKPFRFTGTMEANLEKEGKVLFRHECEADLALANHKATGKRIFSFRGKEQSGNKSLVPLKGPKRSTAVEDSVKKAKFSRSSNSSKGNENNEQRTGETAYSMGDFSRQEKTKSANSSSSSAAFRVNDRDCIASGYDNINPVGISSSDRGGEVEEDGPRGEWVAAIRAEQNARARIAALEELRQLLDIHGHPTLYNAPFAEAKPHFQAMVVDRILDIMNKMSAR